MTQDALHNCIRRLASAWHELELISATSLPRPKWDPTTNAVVAELTSGFTKEWVSHLNALSAAQEMEASGVPGAGRFRGLYERVVKQFLDYDSVGANPQIGWFDPVRAEALRPVAMWMLAAFARETTDATEPALPLGVIGGGRDRVPRGPFLDLVRKLYAGASDVRQVFITDPYVLSDVGEAGSTGGFDGMIDYLKTLRLTRDSSFELRITPAPRQASDAAIHLLERCVTAAFPSATIGRFHGGSAVHDRFYLTSDERGQRRGIFGPSLNGLNAHSVVVMGALTQKDVDDLFRLLAPRAGR